MMMKCSKHSRDAPSSWGLQEARDSEQYSIFPKHRICHNTCLVKMFQGLRIRDFSKMIFLWVEVLESSGVRNELSLS